MIILDKYTTEKNISVKINIIANRYICPDCSSPYSEHGIFVESDEIDIARGAGSTKAPPFILLETTTSNTVTLKHSIHLEKIKGRLNKPLTYKNYRSLTVLCSICGAIKKYIIPNN
jgi:RNase P subunit RPR2